MTTYQATSLLWRHLTGIILSGILFTFIISMVFVLNSHNFRGRTDFLIVQSGASDRDLYSLSKSAEYIGNVLSDAIHSELFIDETMKLNRVGTNVFPVNARDRLKAWERTVSVRKNFQSSILSVEVVGDNGLEVLQLSKAIADVLAHKNHLFRTGSPEEVTVRVLSGPIIEKTPNEKELAAVGGGSFLAGVLLAAFGYIAADDRAKRARPER